MKAVQHSRRDRIRAQLADLKTPGALEALAVVLSEVDVGEASPAEAIERLLRAQISLRNDRSLDVKRSSDSTPYGCGRRPRIERRAASAYADWVLFRAGQIETLVKRGAETMRLLWAETLILGGALVVSSCSGDIVDPPSPPIATDAVSRMAEQAGLDGPIAVAELPDGRFLLGSSRAASLFAPNYWLVASAPKTSELTGSRQLVLAGNDSPESNLVLLVEPGPSMIPGVAKYSRNPDNTSGVNWTFGCVDPSTGQFFPMDEARVDSTVNEAIDQTGGHDNGAHDITEKPTAEWDPRADIVSDGHFSQSYTADIAAGDEVTDFHYVITDPAAPTGCRNNPQVVSFLTAARVRGLVELVAGTEHMYFDDITSDHFSVFYVTPGVKAATDNTAALFFQAMSGSDSLRVNAASLIYGGLNDAPTPDWDPPHSSHRLGTDLDFDGATDAQTIHEAVVQAGHDSGFEFCFAEKNSAGVADHVHCFHRTY